MDGDGQRRHQPLILTNHNDHHHVNQLQPTAYKLMARDPVTVMARPESAIMR